MDASQSTDSHRINFGREFITCAIANARANAFERTVDIFFLIKLPHQSINSYQGGRPSKLNRICKLENMHAEGGWHVARSVHRKSANHFQIG